MVVLAHHPMVGLPATLGTFNLLASETQVALEISYKDLGFIRGL